MQGNEEEHHDTERTPCRNVALVRKKKKTKATAPCESGTFRVVTPPRDIFCGRASCRMEEKGPQGGHTLEDGAASARPCKDRVVAENATMVERDVLRAGASRGTVQQRIAAVEGLAGKSNIHGAREGRPAGGRTSDHAMRQSTGKEETAPCRERGEIGLPTKENKRKREGKGTVVDVPPAVDVEPAMADDLPTCGDPVTPSGEESQLRPQMAHPREDVPEASPLLMKDGFASSLKYKSRSKVTIQDWASDLIRVHQKARKTVEDEFVIAVGMGAAQALEEKYCRYQEADTMAEGSKEYCGHVDDVGDEDVVAIQDQADGSGGTPELLDREEVDTVVEASYQHRDIVDDVEDGADMAIEDEVDGLEDTPDSVDGQETLDS